MRYWTQEDNKRLIESKTDQEITENFPDADLRSLKRRRREILQTIRETGHLPKIREAFIAPKNAEEYQFIQEAKQVKSQLESQNKFLYEENRRLASELDAAMAIRRKTPQTFEIPKKIVGQGNQVAVIEASDWHYEEKIGREMAGLNEYNLAVADERIGKFWQNTLNFLEIGGRQKGIVRIVLALLGDFINGSIHEENIETNQLRPMEAALAVQNHLASGIEFLLKNTDCPLIIPCHPGNHSRITKKIHFSTETGNAIESYLYENLAIYFRKEKRIQFMIAEGYHTYLTVCDYVLRFHHGHAIRYQGGVGGLAIPVNKAIAQWNKARWADLDIFGHWHYKEDRGNFVANGSLVGYNSYAKDCLKAEPQEPQQVGFFITPKHGKGTVAPLWAN